MYHRILVAVDNSELSQRAFHKALSIARAFSAKLQIINVVSPLIAEYQDTASLAFSESFLPDTLPDTLNETTREEWVSIRDGGLNLLRSLQQQAERAGVKAEMTQQIGQIDEGITEFAKSWHADLIVIGSHGRKGFTELLFGSVSNYVSHHVSCSVLLVHQEAELSAEQFIEE